MAVLAYVLVETAPGKARGVRTAMTKIAGVKEAHAVTGRYDVIARLEARDVKVLGDTVLNRIAKVAGVARTVTNVVVD